MGKAKFAINSLLLIGRGRWVHMGLLLMLIASPKMIAQSPPAWQPMGDLSDAEFVYDIFEIPNTNIVLACGQRASYSYFAIWRSDNGGATWSRVADGYSGELYRFLYDGPKHLIFSYGSTSNSYNGICVFFSNDNGATWTGIYNPPILETSNAVSGVIDTTSQYIYLIFYVTHPGGPDDGYFGYHPELWRLNYSDPDPNNWTWEFLMIYPEGEVSGTNIRPTIALKDTILYAFMKDDINPGLRIYTHSINQLGSKAKIVCSISEAAEYFNAHPIATDKSSDLRGRGVNPTNPAQQKQSMPPIEKK